MTENQNPIPNGAGATGNLAEGQAGAPAATPGQEQEVTMPTGLPKRPLLRVIRLALGAFFRWLFHRKQTSK